MGRSLKTVSVVFLCMVFLLIASCSASKELQGIENDNYKIVNEVLNAIELKHHDSIAFDPLSNNKRYRGRNLNKISNSGLYSSCDLEKLRDWLQNFSSKNFANKMFSENIKWDPSKITNPKVKIGFSLKEEENIKKYNKEKDRLNKGLDRDYAIQILWNIENNEPIIQVSNPIFGKKNNYSILFSSSEHFGVEAWILHKKQKKWYILCNRQIAF